MKNNNNEFRHMLRGCQKSALNHQDFCQIQNLAIKNNNCNNKALLMLHGFTSSPAVFRLLIPEILHYDAIICPVLPGHTGYLDDLKNTSAQKWIETAEQACESLLSEYQKVDVLGLSLGGMLACHLNQKYPVNHLYLLAPAFDLQTPITPTLILLKCLRTLGFRQLRANAGNIQGENTEISFRRIPLDTIIEILTFIRDFKWVIPENSVDLLLGRHDAVVNSEKIAERFKHCKQLNLHWLDNSAHVLPLDNDRKLITACLNTHL